MRSRKARGPDEHGKMLLTRAIEAVYASLECKKHGVSRRKVREFLEKNCGCGAHHVAGPTRVNLVNYYSTALTDDQKRQLLGNGKKQPEPAV